MGNDVNKMEITGYKLTDKEGFPFYTKQGKYKLEVGKTIVADDFIPNNECGHGIHFCKSICSTVPHGIVAASLDSRYAKPNEGYPDIYVFANDGFKVFEIKATNTQELDGGKI